MAKKSNMEYYRHKEQIKSYYRYERKTDTWHWWEWQFIDFKYKGGKWAIPWNTPSYRKIMQSKQIIPISKLRMLIVGGPNAVEQ